MKRIVVEFKEKYLDIPVVRECVLPSLDDVIRIYGLNNSDIEYWKLLKEQDV